MGNAVCSHSYAISKVRLPSVCKKFGALALTSDIDRQLRIPKKTLFDYFLHYKAAGRELRDTDLQTVKVFSS